MYWDTDSLDLVRQGFGLRHRRRLDRPEHPGIWTLKTPGHADGDRMVRGEHELAAAGGAPPPALLARIPADVPAAALHPVALLRATRRVLTLGEASAQAGGRAIVEVMDDTVEVAAPDGSVADRFRELEVEIQDGGTSWPTGWRPGSARPGRGHPRAARSTAGRCVPSATRSERTPTSDPAAAPDERSAPDPGRGSGRAVSPGPGQLRTAVSSGPRSAPGPGQLRTPVSSGPRPGLSAPSDGPSAPRRPPPAGRAAP